jgi:pilus assembly protein CpaB
MNRNRLLMIGFIALAMVAFVSLLVYRNLESGRGKAQPGEDVFVAADDLQVGTKIEDKDIKYAHFPSSVLPVGVFHRRDKLIGRGVIQPVSKDELILSNKLAGENAGYGLPALIPPGMRAVSVRVNDTSSVSGFVLPGTRVDVLLTGEPQGSTQTQTTTVLENVLVLANGPRLERAANGGEAIATSVITLLVSPDDAQKLTLASNQGRIQLALRNPLDTRQQDIASARTDGLYKGGAPAPVQAPVARPKVKSPTPPPATLAPPAPFTVEIYKGSKLEKDNF